jgi:hypothetical protein
LDKEPTMIQRLTLLGRVMAMVVAMSGFRAAQASMITTSPGLPPLDGAYVSPAEAHAIYGPAVLTQIRHSGFANIMLMPVGPDIIETFDSMVTGLVELPGPMIVPLTLHGPVTVRLFNYNGMTTGTFQTEMLQLDLVGTLMGNPVMIRESPTLPSLGQTTVTDIGGGQFRIDSFFDVFTELSLDGGQTWIPDSSGPTRVNLIPSPAMPALWALAALAALRRQRR